MTAAHAPAPAAAGGGQPAVEIDGLVKRYGGRPAVDGLSLTVPRGVVFALLGPNGAGKTTTVETIEGYRRPDGGRVRVLGLDPIADGRALRGRLGLMLQSGGIYPQARPRELLQLYARFYARPLDPDGLLERVGLAGLARRRYRTLSGGEKQRLSLALALVGRPELVVLDEPTAGMDPQARAATRELVSGLRADGVTVLLTSHDLADVEQLADRIALIDRGRLVAEGTTAELLAGAAPRLRFRLDAPLAEPARADLARRLAALDASARLVAEAEGRVRVEDARPTPELVAELGRWCAEHGLLLAELRTDGGSLEERYLELVGDDRSAA